MICPKSMRLCRAWIGHSRWILARRHGYMEVRKYFPQRRTLGTPLSVSLRSFTHVFGNLGYWLSFLNRQWSDVCTWMWTALFGYMYAPCIFRPVPRILKPPHSPPAFYSSLMWKDDLAYRLTACLVVSSPYTARRRPPGTSSFTS